MNTFIQLLVIIVSGLLQSSGLENQTDMGSNILYLEAGEGELVYGYSSEPCEYYFHVPITYGNQVPLILTVEAPDLIDYRFLKGENNNVLCVVRMGPGQGTISWKSIVMIERNMWNDIPQYVAIPDPASLPDSVTSWLASTDCCQLNSPYVIDAVQDVGSGIDDVIELADSVESYVENIPWEYPHTPISFDAHYAIRWGSSCTGHAHAAASLFRGNGIPSRSLLNLTTFIDSTYWFDQHWIVDYYIPDYGWVMAETGNPTVFPQNYIVTYVVQSNQEFTKWRVNSIDALWHSSDPNLFGPQWAQSHRGYSVGSFQFNDSLISETLQLGAELWDLHTTCTGQILSSADAAQRVQAEDCMALAYEAMHSGDIDSYIAYAEDAVSHYQSISLEEMEVIYFEDFESGAAGWTHGGEQDQWQLGSPQSGPNSAYSGNSCWATNLSGNYENDSDCWLLSPVIDLDNLSCAELSFWLWNDVEDFAYVTRDKLYVEFSIDGEDEFITLSFKIAGLNNDPEIVAVGGWTKIVLDLRRIITNQVQFRFFFDSNAQNTFPGAYIDDFTVTGRYKDLTGITSSVTLGNSCVSCSPNPCSFATSINLTMPVEGEATVTVYDLTGRRVAVPAAGRMAGGQNSLAWDCRGEDGRHLPAGIYIVRVQMETGSVNSKLVITSH